MVRGLFGLIGAVSILLVGEDVHCGGFRGARFWGVRDVDADLACGRGFGSDMRVGRDDEAIVFVTPAAFAGIKELALLCGGLRGLEFGTPV